MKIEIFSVGRVRQRFVQDGEDEYLTRLKPLMRVELNEIDNSKFAGLPEEKLTQKEAELVLGKVRPDAFFVLLDERGRALDSIAFAETIKKESIYGRGSIAFAIGGAFGWHNSVRERADLELSLSPFTFTYQMTRLILIEQIYRAMTIIKGMPYHKGER